MTEEKNPKKTVVRRVKAGDNDSSSTTKATAGTKVTAKKSPASGKKTAAPSKATPKKVVKKATPTTKKPAAKTAPKPKKKPFFLLVPVIGTGRYIRNSWRELRQVRWTNRRATWGLTLAVILFSVFFATFILLFDKIFDWLIKEVIL
ncbi:preprotein translocase subunit SecE [Candidatus Saccharibacteria bacterium]|nr:preprotein translocase subunit SecE [Candidatus Saccharibacteria bacterium]